MMSASRQQPCLQCVDVVDCHHVWSEDRSQWYVWMSAVVMHFIACENVISFDTCHSGCALSGNGSAMTTGLSLNENFYKKNVLVWELWNKPT